MGEGSCLGLRLRRDGDFLDADDGRGRFDLIGAAEDTHDFCIPTYIYRLPCFLFLSFFFFTTRLLRALYLGVVQKLTRDYRRIGRQMRMQERLRAQNGRNAVEKGFEV